MDLSGSLEDVPVFIESSALLSFPEFQVSLIAFYIPQMATKANA